MKAAGTEASWHRNMKSLQNGQRRSSASAARHKDKPDVVLQNEECKVKRGVTTRVTYSHPAALFNQIDLRKSPRPVERYNYCQTRKRRNNSILGKSNAEMCLETGVVTEGQPESLPAEGQKLLSTYPFFSKTSKVAGLSCQEQLDVIYQHGIRFSADLRENQKNFQLLKNKEIKLHQEKKCTLCDKVFIDLHEYTLHLKQQHQSNKNQLHICNICDKKLSSASSLDRHLLVHTGYRPHKCEICNVTFTTNGNMNRHMRIHDKIKIARSKTRRNMKNRKYPQNSGNKLSTSSTDGESILMEAQENSQFSGNKTPISSTEVESTMKTQELFQNNDNKPSVSNSERVSTVKTQKNDNCKVSKTSVPNTDNLSTLKKRKNCHSGSKTSVSSNNDENAVKKRKNDHCSENKTSVSMTEGKNEVKKPKGHECTDCTPGFIDLTHMGFSSKHFPMIARLLCEKRRRCLPIHINLDERNLKILDNLNPPKLCEICNFSFPCQRSLDLHLMAHSHKKSLFCKYCGIGFSSPESFLSHEFWHEIKNMEHEMESLEQKRAENFCKDNYMGNLGLFNRERMRNRISHENEEPKVKKNMNETFLKNLSNDTSITDKEISMINSKPDCQTDSSNDFADISSIVSLTSKSSIPNIRASPIIATPASPQGADQIPATPASPQGADQISATPASPQGCVQFSEAYQNLQSNVFEFRAFPRTTPQSGDKIPVPVFVEGSASSLQVSGIEIGNKFCSDVKLQNSATRHINPKISKSKKYSKKTLHKCQKCNYTSLDKSTLSRHMRTHNGERPFMCGICNYAFTTKANSHRHIIKRHRILKRLVHKYSAYTTSKCRTKSSGNGINNNVHKVYCQFCKKGFDNSRVLQHHLRSTSTSCPRKPYFCRLCNSGFTTKNNCNRHISNQHPNYNAKQLIHVNKLQLHKTGNNSNNQNEQILNLTEDDASSNDQTEKLTISLENNVEEEQNNQQENVNETTPIEMEKSPTNENEKDRPTTPIYYDMVCENKEQNPKIHSVQLVDQTLMDHTQYSTSLEYSETVHKKLNTSDEVFALHGLMCLSVPFQKNDHDNQPLDLSVRPVDLSTKKSNIQQSASTEGILQHLPNVPSLKSTVLLKPQPAHTSTFIPQVMNSSQTLSIEPVNLCKVSSPSPIFPTQHSTPYHTTVKPIYEDLPKNDLEIPKKKASPKKDIECQYCGKRFSNKSNKERHIKKQHPECTQSTRNNLKSVTAMPELQKQSQNVSDVTKNRLRSVLIPKVNNSNNHISHDDDSSGSETALCIVENMNTDSSNESGPSEDSFLKSAFKSDNENNDLASVSSVIDTANSREISRFLNDASFTEAQAPKPHSNGGKSNMSRNLNGKTKRYACEFCQQTFSSSSARERHTTTHTGERNFECSECGSRFTTKSNRDRHVARKCCSKRNYKLKIWHSTLNLKLEPVENTSNDIHPDDSYNKPVSLSESNAIDKLQDVGNRSSCLNRLEDEYHLNTAMHVQSFPIMPELECQICNNTYKNNDDLTNHMKQLHPLEYKSLMGEEIHPEDAILSLKRNGLMKKRFF